MATKETYGLMGFVDEQGNTHIHRPITNADLVGYDNKKSKLKAEDAQAAIDELSAALDAVKPLSGTEDPTSSTKGAVGQHYTNTTTGQEFTCIAADEEKGVYTWEVSGGGSGGGTLKLHAIHIKTAPAKTEYKAGETFDPAGMVITADYAIDGVVIIEAQEASDYTYPTAPLAAGDSSVTISLTKNGITMTATQAITCTKTVVPVPTFTETRFYNANTQTFNFNNEPSSSIATKTGETSGLAAGSYTTHFELNNPALFEWADISFNGDVVCTIQKVTPTVTKPTIAAGMTYNGNSRALTATAGSTNFGTLQYSTDNATWSATPPTATNAGTYTVHYRVVGDSNINDVASASIGTVTINKATGTLSVNPASVTLNSDQTEATVTAVTNSDGQITATPQDTSIVKATVTGNTVKIESVNNTTGETTVTISVGEGTNWTKPSDASVSVNASFFPAKGKKLEDYTWEEISRISKAGLASTYFETGDTKTISFNGTNYLVQIIGFDHDDVSNSSSYGRNKAGITFQFGKANDSANAGMYSKYYLINSSNSNENGWIGCLMRTSTMPLMKSYMPADLQSVLVTVNKISGRGNKSSSGTEKTQDELFLLSEIEVSGGKTHSVSGEGTQYAFYQSGGRTVRYNTDGSTYSWWERSPSSGGASFCYVLGDGTVGTTNTTASTRGVSFGFCV